MPIPTSIVEYADWFSEENFFWSFTKARAVREEIIDDIVLYHLVLEGFVRNRRVWDRESQRQFADEVKRGSTTGWARELKTLCNLLGSAWVTVQNRVQLTDIGWELLQTDDPLSLLEHQVRKYQIGNPQLDDSLTSAIAIIPHYILLEFLLHSYPEPLTNEECALFLMKVRDSSEILAFQELLDAYRNLTDEERKIFIDRIDEDFRIKVKRVWSYGASFLTLPRYVERRSGQISIVDLDEARRVCAWYNQGHNTHIDFRSQKDWFSHYGGLDTTPNPLMAADYYRKIGDTEEAVAAYGQAIEKGMAPVNDSTEDYRCRINGEAAIEDWLVGHLDRIEPGLELIERQYETSSAGRIDILAQDSDCNHVVIELKRDKASDVALGQILRYLGWVRLNLSESDEVRGFVIGSDIDKHMGYAIRAHDVLPRLCNIKRYEDLGVQLRVRRTVDDCRAWVEDLGES